MTITWGIIWHHPPKRKQHQQQHGDGATVCKKKSSYKILRSEGKLENTFWNDPDGACRWPPTRTTIPHPSRLLCHLPLYLERNKYMPTINVYCCLLSNCYCFSIMMPFCGAPYCCVVFRDITFNGGFRCFLFLYSTGAEGEMGDRSAEKRASWQAGRGGDTHKK